MIQKNDFFDLKKCRIIAEVSQTHEGSLGLAHAFVDAVADAGADTIKFQTHIADAESTPQEQFRVKFSQQDATRYDYWKRMEFTESQWKGLADHARDRGLFFLSSPFSIEAVELLERVGVPAWKVGSGETRNWPLLKKMAETGKPILLSSGMSSWSEIDESVKFLKSHRAQFALLQATTMYPTPPSQVGLNNIVELKNKFQCPVGLSDHSATIFPSLAAVGLGAQFLEVHVTLSPKLFGPDVSSSVTVEELAVLVRGVRFLEESFANPVNKDQKAQELEGLKKLFGRSVVPRENIEAGTVLESKHLSLKKPAGGIPGEDFDKLLGMRTLKKLEKNQWFQWSDLEKKK